MTFSALDASHFRPCLFLFFLVPIPLSSAKSVRHTAVPEGATISLPCRWTASSSPANPITPEAAEELSWAFGRHRQKEIFVGFSAVVGGKWSSRKLDLDPVDYGLVVHDVELRDSGYYSCVNGDQEADRWKLSVLGHPVCSIATPESQRLVGRNISLACEMAFGGETPSVEWTMESEEGGLGDPLPGVDERDSVVGVQFNFTVLKDDVGRKVICVGKHPHWNATFDRGPSCDVLINAGEVDGTAGTALFNDATSWLSALLLIAAIATIITLAIIIYLCRSRACGGDAALEKEAALQQQQKQLQNHRRDNDKAPNGSYGTADKSGHLKSANGSSHAEGGALNGAAKQPADFYGGAFEGHQPAVTQSPGVVGQREEGAPNRTSASCDDNLSVRGHGPQLQQQQQQHPHQAVHGFPPPPTAQEISMLEDSFDDHPKPPPPQVDPRRPFHGAPPRAHVSPHTSPHHGHHHHHGHGPPHHGSQGPPRFGPPIRSLERPVRAPFQGMPPVGPPHHPQGGGSGPGPFGPRGPPFGTRSQPRFPPPGGFVRPAGQFQGY